MEIKVKCTRIIEESNLLGFFNASFDDKIVIRDIKLIKGKNGQFIGWPNKAIKKDDETEYIDMAFVMDKDLKAELEKKIKKAYKKAQEDEDE